VTIVEPLDGDGQITPLALSADGTTVLAQSSDRLSWRARLR
jgi:hypothetical protein